MELPRAGRRGGWERIGEGPGHLRQEGHWWGASQEPDWPGRASPSPLPSWGSASSWSTHTGGPDHQLPAGRPFLHRGLHHGSPAPPRPSGLPRWCGGSRGLPLPRWSSVQPGDGEGTRGPLMGGGGETASLLSLIRATRAPWAEPVILLGLLLSLWDHPSPNGSQAIFFRPHRGFMPLGLRLGVPLLHTVSSHT